VTGKFGTASGGITIFTSHRQSSSAASTQAFDTTAYVSHDSFTRWAGQRAQIENRTTLGGTVRKVWTGNIGNALPIELLIGGDYRTDLVDATQYPSADQHQIGGDVVGLAYAAHGVGAFSQIQVKPLDWLKLTVGSRYDHFFYDVHNHLDSVNSPAINSGVWSPKVGIAVTPIKGVELYANYGEGFGSPSVVDDLLSNPALQPMKLVSKEVGIHITALPRTSLLVDAWTTDIANESFQAAPGLPEQNIGRSRRSGYDVEARYRLRSGEASAISLFSNLGIVSAHLIDQGPAAIYVPYPSDRLSEFAVNFGPL